MNTRNDVAAALGITPRRLRYILYGRRDRRAYQDFQIPKRGAGFRTISSPPPHLKWLQKKLYTAIRDLYVPKSCVHGFAPGRSIVTNAQFHVKRRFVVNFDLQNFFPSIHIGRVIGVFRKLPFLFGREASETLAQICCRDDGVLPQGGVMSPLMSNFVCRGLDNDLLTFAKAHGLRYSRYADDLTFSSSRSSVPSELIDMTGARPLPGLELDRIVTRNKFAIHTTKIKYRSHNRRQEVTGLTVNKFPNVQRTFVRQLESAIHACKKFGFEGEQHDYDDKYRKGGGILLANVIWGRLSYLKMVRGDHDYIFRRLARMFNRLDTRQVALDPIEDAKPCPMRSLSCAWNTWIGRYASAVFHLLFTDDKSESCGTTFHIGGGVLVTARHNAFDGKGDARSDLEIKVGSRRLPVIVMPNSHQVPQGLDIACLHCEELDGTERIPTQLRLPEIGEEVAAIGFPSIPQRQPSIVAHIGHIESLPVNYRRDQRSIQVSFQSGGGLSGGCLIDKSGHLLGVMTQNVYMSASSHEEQKKDTDVEPNNGPEESMTTGSQPPKKPKLATPMRAYGQAVPIEYVDHYLNM